MELNASGFQLIAKSLKSFLKISRLSIHLPYHILKLIIYRITNIIFQFIKFCTQQVLILFIFSLIIFLRSSNFF